MIEQVIENYLRNEVEKIGGLCFKWVSPGNKGVPDRIVILPRAKVFFIELKKPGERATKLQEYHHRMLRAMGHYVNTFDSLDQVDAFIKWIKENDNEEK